MPGRAYDECVDVNRGHRDVACGTAFCGSCCCCCHWIVLQRILVSKPPILSWRRSSTHFRYVSANVQHGDTAKGGTPEQTFSATNFLNDVEGECAHSQGLRNTIETSREKLGRSSCNAKSLKDPRRIVGDDVLESRIRCLQEN